MHTALQIGTDPSLMHSRAGVIASAGLQVRNLDFHELGEFLAAGSWDLAILCHTLNRAQRAQAVSELRKRKPIAPILLVSGQGSPTLAEARVADAVLDPNPVKLVHEIQRILALSRQLGSRPGVISIGSKRPRKPDPD